MRWLPLVLLAACSSSDLRKYDNGLFELAAGFNAKEACSCLFVSERPEEDCKQWVRVSPNVAGFKIDDDAPFITSRALGGSKTIGRLVDEDLGCLVDAR
jgi:hypothetical protein